MSQAQTPMMTIDQIQAEMLAECEALLAGHIDVVWQGPLTHVQALRQTGGRCKGLAMRANPVSEARAEASGVALPWLNPAAQPHPVLPGPVAGRAVLAEAPADPASCFELPREGEPDRGAEARRRRALPRSTACSASSAKE